MEPENISVEEEEEAIDFQINPEDIQEEIILDDNDNIFPDDLDEDDGSDIPNENDDYSESEDDDDITVEEKTQIQENENLDTPVTKVTHTGDVYSLQFNPSNPRIFASGSGDDTARIWNLDSLEKFIPLVGHTDSVIEVQFSPDGNILATAGLDAILKLWNLDGSLLHSLDGPSESIECCAWHPRGPIIVAGGGDGSAWMWETKKGDCMGVFSGHSDVINCITFTLDGKKIITASNDCTVRIWDPKTMNTLHTIKEGTSGGAKYHQSAITALACYSKQDIFVTGGDDGFVSVCESTNGKIYSSFEGHSDSIESIEFLPSLNCCVTSSMDKTVQIFDLNTSQRRSAINFDDGVVRLRTNDNHPNLLFASCLDGTISICDYRTASIVKKIVAHSSPVLDIALCNGGLLSGSEDFSIKFWNI